MQHRRSGGWQPRSTARPFVVALLVVALAGTGPGGIPSAFAFAQEGPDAAAWASVTAMRAHLEALAESIDATRLSVEDVSFDLAFEEAGDIVALVRDEIAFEPYDGLLRGAVGTLVSRAGNAFDQSVLLATLLANTGHDVRILRGEVDDDVARALLASVHANAPSTTFGLSGPTGADVLGGIDADALIARVEAGIVRLTAEVDATTAFLDDSLRRAGIAVADASDEALLRDARDYAWVEYRVSEAQPWTAAHPAFPTSVMLPAALEHLEASDELVSDIPEELQHRFRFQAFVEQRLGDDLQSVPVMEAWERPVANLLGVSLLYTMIPNGLDESAPHAQSMDETLAATTLFTPFFDGSIPDGALMVDLDGNAVDPMAGESAMAGVFQTAGGLFGGAAGLLAGESDPDAFVTLTRHWLEYTLIAPGGEETTYTRTIVDRIGALHRAEGRVEILADVTEEDVARSLIATHSFMVTGATITPSYQAKVELEAALANVTYLETFLRDAFDAPSVPSDATLRAGLPVDHIRFFAASDASSAAEGMRSYRPAPAIVVVQHAPALGRSEVDIVANPRRVVEIVEGMTPRLRPDLVMAHGVWDTRVEGIPLHGTGGERRTTFGAFEAARADGIPLRILSPDDREMLDAIDVPAATRHAIVDDLEGGFAVIVPQEPSQAYGHPAWWRVHPVTGETLGRGADGRGQEMTEYGATFGVADKIGWSVSAVTASFGVGACIGKHPVGGQQACCIYETLAIATTTFMVGSVVGLAAAGVGSGFAMASIVLFGAIDVAGAGAAVSTLDVPSICSGLASCPFVTVSRPI
jgi:hypothetical protein